MSKLNYQQLHDYKLPFPEGASGTETLANIQHLYKKMSQCTRNITYFDLYKFNSVISDPNQLQAQINALEPYTAAIINANINTGDGFQYTPGDILVKNNDNTVSIIKAQRGGIFYPSSISRSSGTDNYTYNIEFSFQSAEPSVDKYTLKDTHQWDATKKEIISGADNTWNLYDNGGNDPYARHIVFEGLAGKSVGSPYNYVYNSISNPLSLEAKKDTSNKPIPPIIHYYANLEELYLDQVVSYDEETNFYTITTTSACKICNKVVVK